MLSCITSTHLSPATHPPTCTQVLYIDHAKAKDCEEQILEVNAVPAAHSKGLLQQPHPGNTPMPMAVDPQQRDQAAAGEGSDVSDDEVAEAADAGRAAAEGAGPSKL